MNPILSSSNGQCARRRLTPAGLRRLAGTAMVEVMVGLLILATVIPAIYTCVLQGNRLNFHSSETFAAMALCKEKIEELKNMTTDQIIAQFTRLQGNDYILIENNVNIAVRGVNFSTQINGTRKTYAYQYRPAARTTNFDAGYFDIKTEFTWTSAAKLWKTTTYKAFTRIYPR